VGNLYDIIEKLDDSILPRCNHGRVFKGMGLKRTSVAGNHCLT